MARRGGLASNSNILDVLLPGSARRPRGGGSCEEMACTGWACWIPTPAACGTQQNARFPEGAVGAGPRGRRAPPGAAARRSPGGPRVSAWGCPPLTRRVMGEASQATLARRPASKCPSFSPRGALKRHNIRSESHVSLCGGSNLLALWSFPHRFAGKVA